MFTWDIRKALTNLEKHGVSFDEAASVFDDPVGLEVEDARHSIKEQRYIRVAKSSTKRVLTVVYTFRRTDRGKETIRLISARFASRKERAAYRGQ